MSLKEIRISKGYSSARKAAESLEIPQPTYQNYETGTRDPDTKTWIKMADFFGVSVDQLMGHSTESKKNLPILGLIRAGLPILAEENYSETITVGQFERGADFALRVTGDSMIYAGIRSGDIVLLQQTEHAESGQIVAATVQDMDCMATLKYYVNGKQAPTLRAANPKYQDQPITANHRIIGVFVGLIRTEEPGLHEYQSLIASAENIDLGWGEAMAELSSVGWGLEEVKNLVNMVRMAKK